MTKVQKWGKSQGVGISKELLAGAKIAVGDEVEIALRDGALVVTPVRRVRGGHDLRELVRRIPKGYRATEVEWREAAGCEVW